MSHAVDSIPVSHAGSLPRSPELLAANAAIEAGEPTDAINELRTAAVVDIVKRQHDLGVTLPGDGEYGKSMSTAVDYGAWWSYSFSRTGGLALDEDQQWLTTDVQSTPGNIRTTGFGHRRDQAAFREAYTDPESGIFSGGAPKLFPKVVDKLTYTGHDAVARDIANLKTGLAATGLEQGFITSIAPGSAMRIGNDHYSSDEELVYAWADVLREEYVAIVEAGLIVQIDDPSLAENWDQITPEPSIKDYLAFSRLRIEALNHALRGLPEEQIRYHLCWGSWHGPHTTDLEFRHIVDTMLTVNAGSYSFEAGNVRHEHEYTVWDDITLPEGKILVPGVVSHATNVVEHPDLVAERITRFATRVGRSNVIASTDCGLGGRIHPQIATAKLETLAEGARRASAQLWK